MISLVDNQTIMSINSLCDDILIKIMSYLEDNFSSINYSISCKYIKNLFSKEGFLKKIELNNNSDTFKIMYSLCLHSNSLNLFIARNVSDPNLFLPNKWCKEVIFMYCNLKSDIDPSEKVITEVIEIVGFPRKQIKIIKINFNKFPKLKVLKINDDSKLNLFDESKLPREIKFIKY